MKRKADFVTNSSSTSFTFIFKGTDKKHLFDLLLARKQLFDLHYESEWDDEGTVHECTVEDVIAALDKFLSGRLSSLDFSGKVEYINDLLARRTADIRSWEEMYEDDVEDWEQKWITDSISEIKQIIGLIKGAKDRGLLSVVQMGFGDNHGEVWGDGLGVVMDYKGRGIFVNDDDLVIFTEQNR